MNYDLDQLKALGFHVQYRTIDCDQVESVYIPLMPEEWCALCMRDGDYYVGGCCGQTGLIQDCFNSLFRNSGYAASYELLQLANRCQNHEGFEIFSEPLSQEKFDKYIVDWRRSIDTAATTDSWILSPIIKIGLCYRAVEDKLHESRLNVPTRGHDYSDPADVFYALYHNIEYLNYKDLFSDPNEVNGQKHANIQLRLARLLPAAVKLQEAIAKLNIDFQGYGLFETDTNKLCGNSYGECLYYTREEAQKILDLWQKSEAKAECRWTIRSVSVSLNDGLLIGE
ncbi:hypothetical protein C4588_02795 [Candidatus Parcubacteria bacterium]|nr:MAG: hypothetical protein C4588_02795 [Candidatus Parcubacteria bacterium]